MNSQSSTFRSDALFRTGFTIIEMVVAVSLLVVVILGVGVVFKGATDAVGVSERTLDMLSNVRSVQAQIERDVAGMDKNCFLVIRSPQPYTFIDSTGVNAPHRCDLVSFISYGSFHHRTGGVGPSFFTDNNTVTPSAFITWGQLAMEKLTIPTGSDYITSSQSFHLLLTQTPTGVISTPTGNNEGGMALGRIAMLLAPQSINSGMDNDPAGLTVRSFQNGTHPAIDYNATSVTPVTSESSSGSVDITQSRIDLAATTPLQIMNYLRQAIGATPGANTPTEANEFCYRHGALASIYDTEVLTSGSPNLVNGYFRMSPIALQGVSSFIVEWTDGVTFYPPGTTDTTTGADISGATEWFGQGNPSPKSWTNGGPRQLTSDSGGDPYAVIFSYDTFRTNWPVALRFRFHVADPTGRLPGGRDFTQIVKLPY